LLDYKPQLIKTPNQLHHQLNPLPAIQKLAVQDNLIVDNKNSVLSQTFVEFSLRMPWTFKCNRAYVNIGISDMCKCLYG